MTVGAVYDGAAGFGDVGCRCKDNRLAVYGDRKETEGSYNGEERDG